MTRNVTALARFYRAITGITPVGSDDYVEFAHGDSVLALCSQEAMELFGAGAAIPASNRTVVIDFEVVDVDVERARLEPLVGAFVQEPVDQPWGTRSMLFRDPDGNLIQFFARLTRGGGIGPPPERSRAGERWKGGTHGDGD
ncbi:MAG TPA: VOC family protein [Opitutaceae bacterium]